MLCGRDFLLCAIQQTRIGWIAERFSTELNLTQHIEYGFEEDLITGAAFVDLTAIYDTVNHRLLLSKILNITKDFRFTEVIKSLLSNCRYNVDFCGKRSRWRQQKNGLLQDSVLAPILYNIYTNDQPVHPGTRSFLYADDLCITSQHKDFRSTEIALSSALDGLSEYYTCQRHTTCQRHKNPCLCIPPKIQGCYARAKLKLEWDQAFTLYQSNVPWCYTRQVPYLQEAC